MGNITFSPHPSCPWPRGPCGLRRPFKRLRGSLPSSFGDEVVIESRVEKFGRSSFDIYHRLLKGEALGAECWETRVWVGRDPNDPARLRGVAIPDEVKAKFEF